MYNIRIPYPHRSKGMALITLLGNEATAICDTCLFWATFFSFSRLKAKKKKS